MLTVAWWVRDILIQDCISKDDYIYRGTYKCKTHVMASITEIENQFLKFFNVICSIIWKVEKCVIY